jgi:hypothetical protein
VASAPPAGEIAGDIVEIAGDIVEIAGDIVEIVVRREAWRGWYLPPTRFSGPLRCEVAARAVGVM